MLVYIIAHSDFFSTLVSPSVLPIKNRAQAPLVLGQGHVLVQWFFVRYRVKYHFDIYFSLVFIYNSRGDKLSV